MLNGNNAEVALCRYVWICGLVIRKLIVMIVCEMRNCNEMCLLGIVHYDLSGIC